jgi:hypothetical protein
VYPNPFNDEAILLIQATNNEKVLLQLFDMMGKLVWERNVNTNENIHIGAEIAEGNYVIKAQYSNGTEQIKKMTKLK